MILNNIKRLNQLNSIVVKRSISTTTTVSSAASLVSENIIIPDLTSKNSTINDRLEFEKILKNTPIRYPGSIDLIHQKPKICVGMSGGIDSTITAKILKHQGFDVTGVFIKSWDEIEESGRCQGQRDYKDAVEAAKYLDIPMFQADFVKDYWNRVFTNFLNDYQKGITPNPDVWCNREIKFDLFLDFARDNLGADYIATGHYSNLYYDESNPSQIELHRSADKDKDQTYFLCMTKTQGLAKSLFPIGGFTKNKIIDYAKTIPNLSSILSKKSSRGICFIGKKSLPEFLSQYLDLKPGFFYDVSKRFMIPNQMHQGSICYTIGQGANIHSASERYYVVSIDIKNNLVNVCPESKIEDFLKFTSFKIYDLNWINKIPKQVFTEDGFDARAQYKHRGELVDVNIKCTEESIKGSSVYIVKVNSDTPIRRLASGQILCIFDKETDKCYGGGVIRTQK